MDVASVRKRLQVAVKKDGNMSAFARRAGVSPELVRLVLLGEREPAGKLLDALGLERRVAITYHPKR